MTQQLEKEDEEEMKTTKTNFVKKAEILFFNLNYFFEINKLYLKKTIFFA